MEDKAVPTIEQIREAEEMIVNLGGFTITSQCLEMTVTQLSSAVYDSRYTNRQLVAYLSTPQGQRAAIVGYRAMVSRLERV